MRLGWIFSLLMLSACSSKTMIEQFYTSCASKSCILDFRNWNEIEGTDLYYFPEQIESKEISNTIGQKFEKDREFACTVIVMNGHKITHVEYWNYEPENSHGVTFSSQFRNESQHFDLTKTIFELHELPKSNIIVMEPKMLSEASERQDIEN